MQGVNWVALSIFALLFAFISWLGFAAARWRRGDLTCCTSGDSAGAASAR